MFGRRILILIPHPDDEVVGCSAAVSRAKALGSTVYCAYLTTGVPAAASLWFPTAREYERKRDRRRREAERAALLLGVEAVLWQETPSRSLKALLPSTRELLVRCIEERKPDVLWAPAYEGGHEDHDVLSYVASALKGLAEVWEFSEYNYAGGRVRYQDFPRGSGADCEIRLERREAEEKLRALRLYPSERICLRHVATRREVFRPLAAYDYSRPPHRGMLYYQRFQWVPFHPRIDYVRPEDVCRALASHPW